MKNFPEIVILVLVRNCFDGKALEKMGYTSKQPRGGSSHYTFRKPGCMPITVPKHYPLNKAYIAMVDEAVRAYLEEDKK